VDVTGVAPKPHAVALQNVLAEDVARFGLTRDQALANAPKSRAGLFLVPSIRED
jgi:aspartyl-tRNA(Asn)/glutamyl-tRNA(Gln) amidotransferase subunit C